MGAESWYFVGNLADISYSYLFHLTEFFCWFFLSLKNTTLSMSQDLQNHSCSDTDFLQSCVFRLLLPHTHFLRSTCIACSYSTKIQHTFFLLKFNFCPLICEFGAIIASTEISESVCYHKDIVLLSLKIFWRTNIVMVAHFLYGNYLITT